MGSAKLTNATPIAMTEPDKKSLKKRILSLFKDKKKDKSNKNDKHNTPEEKEKKPEIKVNPVERILENFDKLRLNDKPEEEDDESQFFSFKVIEDDRRSERIDSHSSEDSGFSETKDVIDSFTNLKITKEENGKDGEKKKIQRVVIARQPVRNSRLTDYSASVRPYQVPEDSYYRQINKTTLTGGQLLVNTPQSDNYSEVATALKSVEKVSQNLQKEQDYWQDVLEIIHDYTRKNDTTDVLSDFIQKEEQKFDYIHVPPAPTPQSNPIEELLTTSHFNYEECDDFSTFLNLPQMDEDTSPKTFIFPTPPRSENVLSPMSESQASFYPSNSDYTLSPERSSPIYNSDYEKYQDLNVYDELPHSIESEKSRDRSSSVSSMTMKQYKDLQKDISGSFSKKECCEISRKSCKDILQEHISKLKSVVRSDICVKISSFDLKTSYGILHHIILSLSGGVDDEDLQYSLFGLISERVLATKPELFAGDFGLNLLKSAALRCPDRPFLTRYLVQTIRTALKLDPKLYAGLDCIFTEVDAQSDNLYISCARAGDSHASVLSELVRNEFAAQPPLFRLHHTNTDGYNALHVACNQHSVQSPRLHITHVLLEHAGADLWKGDVKGGDTPLHLAVNSPNCDLQLIMILFKHVDRKAWKSLAHCRSLSSITPLELARSATKSTTRQNYPKEVLEFLKKCR